MAKAKQTKHTAAEIKAKEKAALTNKARHARLACHHGCSTCRGHWPITMTTKPLRSAFVVIKLLLVSLIGCLSYVQHIGEFVWRIRWIIA